MDPIKQLVEQFSRFPGIGERTALRLVLHAIKESKDFCYALSDSLKNVADRVRECEKCCTITADKDACSICLSQHRDPTLLCVVASVQDLMAIESTGSFKGIYHVLHGTLAPLRGIGPGELRIEVLIKRLAQKDNVIKEVIVATPPSVDGEATALFLLEHINEFKLIVSRIASGVPVGGELQFADRLTLSRALLLRRGFN